MAGSRGLVDWRQLGHAERQPLETVAAEVDLGTRIVTRAFQRQHLTLTKLVVKHPHAGA